MAHTPALDRFFRWLRGGGTKPPASEAARPGSVAPPGLRQQRASRREQLFAMVREQMIRLGVLSSHYKFKVLTLDPAGDQFIVMVDWQPGAPAAEPAFAPRYEAGLQHLLGERRAGFRVKAVYWRDAAAGHSMPAVGAVAAPPARAPAPTPVAAPSTTPHDHDRASEDELAAFRAALRRAEGASASHGGSKPRPLAPQDMPEFAPTERIDDRDAPDGTEFGSLSETQYGKL